MPGPGSEVSVPGSLHYGPAPPPGGRVVSSPSCPAPGTTEGSSPRHAGGGGVQAQLRPGGHQAGRSVEAHDDPAVCQLDINNSPVWIISVMELESFNAIA